jgi:hypothetical protein
MRSSKRSLFLLAGLVLLAVFQAWLLFEASPNPRAYHGRWLEPGDALTGVTVTDVEGGREPLANGDTTVVLVFSPDCFHCETVTPLWMEWIEGLGSHRRAVALTAANPDRARAFIAKHGLKLKTYTLRTQDPGSIEHALASRAPWVFLLGEKGVVLAEGHGGRLGDLTESGTP